MAGISSNRIERMAVTALNCRLESCPQLVANTAINDKTPFIDGSIAIYRSTDICNDNYIGDVPIQIKGKQISKILQPFKYSIRVCDLRNYLYHGGVLYFVIAIDSNDEKNIYYVPLSVIRIQNILKGMDPKQKSVRVCLTKFPIEPNKIMDVISNFHANISKQYSFSRGEMHTLEYWSKNPNFEGFSISANGFGNAHPTSTEIIESVNAHDNYIYVHLAGSPIPIPVSDENVKLSLYRVENKPITINGRVFYDHFEILRDEQKIRIQFGDAFVITSNLQENTTLGCQYNSPQQISKIQKALAFLKAIKVEKQCKIGGCLVPNIEIDISLEEIERQEKHLNEIVELCTTLHIDVDDIKFHNLKPQDFYYLDILYKGIVLGEISNGFRVKEEFEKAIGCTIPITDKIIQVLITKESGGYKIEDYFNIKDKYVLLEKSNGQFVPGTPYTLLTIDDYNSMLNIHYRNIAPTYQKLYDVYPPIIDDAIRILNNILKAYDKSKNEHLLSAAEDLAEFLQDKEVAAITSYTKLLCNLEIVRRHRKLTAEERGRIYEIIPLLTDSFDKFSAFVLLEDNSNAREVFDNLCGECQDYLRTKAIFGLFKMV